MDGRFASGTVPEKLLVVLAKMAYGVGVNFWRGLSVANEPPPLVRTPISNQRSAPEKFAPKSSVAVKRPLLTTVAVFVTVLPTCPAPLLTLNSAKVRS